ncbi:hypothetical protein POSPLADRAFT_1076704, partial [Postia placenta MAD-698-R-SB12]
MFGYNPYGDYSNPYAYSRAAPVYSPDQDYLQALADERAAREQYFAARRAQEEVRERAARARAARQAYTPYNSYYFDDDGTHEDNDSYDGAYSASPYGSYGYGMSPAARQRRVMAEQQRRREQLEREQERLRLEEERRKLAQERRAMKEERMRQLLADEQRRRDEEELYRQRAHQYDPFLRGFGWLPGDGDLNTRTTRTPLRSQTVAPSNRRQPTYNPLHAMHTHLNPAGAGTRSSSVPAHQPPSPVPRHAGTSPRHTIAIRTPSPKERTNSPPNSPAPQHVQQYTPQQDAAARKIQETYRAHAARANALRTIAGLRTRFAGLRSNFVFPAALDFVVPGGGQIAVRADVDALASATQASPDTDDAAEPTRPDADDAAEPTRPDLAYTPGNAPLHAYLEELSRLLTALDAVESRGVAEVKGRRRALVREVEGEAESVERRVRAVWAAWVEKTKTIAEPSGSQSPADLDPAHRTGTAAEAHAAPDSQPQTSAETSMEVERTSPAQPQSDCSPESPDTAIVEEVEDKDAEPPMSAEPHTQLFDDSERMDEAPDEITIEVIEAEPEPPEDEDEIKADLLEDGEKMQVEPAT